MPLSGIKNINQKISTPYQPVTLLAAKTVQNQTSQKLLKCLIDPGSDELFIHEHCLPKGMTPQLINPCPQITLSGMSTHDHIIHLHDIILPEFLQTKHITESFTCYVSKHNNNTDIILGNNVLQPLGINCLSNKQQIQWMEHTIPYKPPSFTTVHTVSIPEMDDPESIAFTTEIKDSNYYAVDTDAVAQ